MSVRALDRAPYETRQGKRKGLHDVGVTALDGLATRNPYGHCARAQKAIIGRLKDDRGAGQGCGRGVESMKALCRARVGAVRENPHVAHVDEVLREMS